MGDIRELEAKVRDLEWRLARYHEHLEEALEHDRQFQLKATWGIVSAACGAGCVWAALWLSNKLGMTGWIFGTIAGFGLLFALGLGMTWGDKGRENDVKKLSRLPKWSKED